MSGPGYAFVPLPLDVERHERKYAVFHRRVDGALFGRVELTLRTEQPVHVGDGHKRLQDGQVVLGGALVRGRPGVPGSSLKGVLRSRYEAITRSCAPLSTTAAKVVSCSHPDIKRAKFDAKAASHDVLVSGRGGCSERRTCPACALFGRMSLRSRVSVLDLACGDEVAHVVATIPERFSPRLHHVGEARVIRAGGGDEIFEVHTLHGRKFAAGRAPVAENAALHRVQAIPAGTAIHGELRLFNVTPAELGGLLTALGRVPGKPAGGFKLGGGKAHGFGRVRVAAIQYRLEDAARAPMAPDEPGWRAAFEGSPDRFDKGEEALLALDEGGI